MCQISTLGGLRTEIFLAILRFVTFCDITLSPHASRLEQVEACGISTCRNSALSGTVPEISANVTFRDIFCYHAWSSRFALETGRGLRPRHNMGHGSSYLRAKIQLSERYCLRDISKCHVTSHSVLALSARSWPRLAASTYHGPWSELCAKIQLYMWYGFVTSCDITLGPHALLRPINVLKRSCIIFAVAKGQQN